MSGWKYISIVVLILLGGVMYFGYWALSQYNLALDTYGASYAQLSASFAAYTKAVSGRTATTTDVSEISTTTPPISGSEIATTTPDISLAFPTTGNDVYIGCSYKIAWQASTTIQSLKVALIDVGTQEASGPIASGLAKENTIEKDSQNLKWKVGVVLPGAYYIKVSNINNIAVEIQSKVFEINKMPVDINTNEQKNICKKSGGLL